MFSLPFSLTLTLDPLTLMLDLYPLTLSPEPY